MLITKYFKLFILGLIIVEKAQAGVAIVDLKCNHNPTLCRDPICLLNQTVDVDHPKLVHITFGCTLIKDVPQLSGTMKLFLKNKNKYTSVGNNMNVEMDFCKVSTILTNQVLTTFVPKLTAQVAATFHPCPYSGEFLVDKFVYDGQHIQAIPGWKNTKAVLSFFRGSFVPLFTVDFYTKAD